MSRLSRFDSLLAQVWQNAISSLHSYLGEEHEPALLSTWAASVLLKTGLSPKEPEIRDCCTQLNNWVERLGTEARALDESSTGLLGLWIHLRRQQRKPVKDYLENLFLHSVEHNLGKPKSLSLSASADLLAAVAAGLGSTSPPDKLRTATSERLQVLCQNASALELVQMLWSWELIQRADDIPHMDVQHRLQSIATNENNTVVERAMAYYGQLRMAELFDAPKIEHEMHFLDCVGLLADSTQDRGSTVTKAYVLSLPYLRRQMSYRSLFDGWRKYADSSFKRAKTENYWGRYLFVICLAGLAAVIYWPWFWQLDTGFQVSIGVAVATVVLMLTTFTVEVTFELHGRQFWQRGKVEILLGLLGALIAVAAAFVEAFLK